MHIRYFTCLLLLLLGTHAAKGQTENIPFDKRHFPDKDLLKKAIGLLEQGERFYENIYGINYDTALYYFSEAHAINPNNAALNLQIGHCYLGLSSGIRPAEAMPYLDKAAALDPQLRGQALYYKGRASHLQSKWEEARAFYVQYEDLLDPEIDEAKLSEVRRRLQECENGKELSAKPIEARFENMGDWINSPYREHSPIISANASVMYFTARLPNTVGGMRDMDGLYFEDVYVTYNRDGAGWTRPRNVGIPINTDLHDATVSLSADATQLIIMREGDLYYSELRDGDWTEPLPFPKNINGRTSFETAASYADDGQTLYFISDRRESLGGKDIFVSYKQDDGTWTDPANLGSGINTPMEENGVFMHPDGTTLYFSSEGHNSIGGTDIFKCVKTGEGWSAPMNAGVPLNTPYDDQCIAVSADYKYGYYSTKGKGALGDHDIFQIAFLDVNEPLAMVDAPSREGTASLAPTRMPMAEGLARTLLAGKVVDFRDGHAMEATVRIERTRDNREVTTVATDPTTGRFAVALPSGEGYRITVRAPRYLYHAATMHRLGEDGRKLVTMLAKIKEIVPDETLVLKDVFFERASARLVPSSYEELNHLAQTMRENPGLVIEIGGHTDNLGNPARLMKLSEMRMQAVRTYLIDRGIEARRLQGKGYGGTQPIADNADPEERAKNRRVEFKVLRIDD